MEEITDEALVKAKQKAVKNLVKDPNAYRDLVIANVKDTEKKDKDLRMQPVKKDNMVDKANSMKVLEKDAKGNVQDNLGKKEKAKSKTGEGVKQMTQTPKKAKGIAQVMEVPGKEKVMALKEHILDELTMQNPNRPQFTSGNRVATKDGKFEGVITKFDGHTATVKLEGDGSERDFQPNVLVHSTGKPYKMNEFEYGDESDYVSDSDAAYQAVETLVNDIEDSTPEGQEPIKTYTKQKLEQIFNDLSSDYGQDLGDKSWEMALDILKKKGYEMTFQEKQDKYATLKEKLIKALKKEILYRNTKTGNVQSFDPAQDRKTMTDPQFNQVFKKA